MSPRKVLMALMGVIASTGLVAGEPPVNPLVEGRELNPVAREFHQAETPVGGYVARADDSEVANVNAWLVMTAIAWDLLLDRLTFPLGIAVQPDGATGV